MRWGVDLLAFLAPMFWLRHLRSTATRADPRARRRGLLAFLAAWSAAWILATVKLVTAPLPVAFGLLFALPILIVHVWPYLLWYALTRRGAAGSRAVVAFAAAAAVAEWSIYTLTPFGTWGMHANAALGDLPLLQLAALTGPTGVGFVHRAAAAALEQFLAGGARRPVAWAGALFVLAHAWGSARLARIDEEAAPVEVVAAVGTDADVSGLPLPTPERTAAWDAALFERTRVAARAGARLVVWTEAATLVRPEDEAAWIERVGELARAEKVAIVAGYILPRSTEPLLYDNAYVLLRPDGGLDHRYLKRHPVPGEPATPGTEGAPVWIDEALGRVSGAICYDYDFPALARARAREDIDLVALPSSDWRGIDPIHTEMARLRAIEGGHSILRSTRFGLAAGIDPAGRIRGRLSAFDGPRRILLVSLPARGRWTLYGHLGEWFVALCAALCVTTVAGTLRGCKSSPSPAAP